MLCDFTASAISGTAKRRSTSQKAQCFCLLWPGCRWVPTGQLSCWVGTGRAHSQPTALGLQKDTQVHIHTRVPRLTCDHQPATQWGQPVNTTLLLQTRPRVWRLAPCPTAHPQLRLHTAQLKLFCWMLGCTQYITGLMMKGIHLAIFYQFCSTGTDTCCLTRRFSNNAFCSCYLDTHLQVLLSWRPAVNTVNCLALLNRSGESPLKATTVTSIHLKISTWLQRRGQLNRKHRSTHLGNFLNNRTARPFMAYGPVLSLSALYLWNKLPFLPPLTPKKHCIYLFGRTHHEVSALSPTPRVFIGVSDNISSRGTNAS